MPPRELVLPFLVCNHPPVQLTKKCRGLESAATNVEGEGNESVKLVLRNIDADSLLNARYETLNVRVEDLPPLGLGKRTGAGVGSARNAVLGEIVAVPLARVPISNRPDSDGV